MARREQQQARTPWMEPLQSLLTETAMAEGARSNAEKGGAPLHHSLSCTSSFFFLLPSSFFFLLPSSFFFSAKP
jgi:hypothetical protein